jgi:cytoskeletal protein CcmA (bactofilin family)
VTFDESSSPDTIYTLATNENALDIASGSSLTVLGSVANDGTIVDDGSLTVGGAVSGNGSLTIDGTATIGSLTLPGQTLTGNGSVTITASLTWDSASTMYVTMDVAYGATATITNTVYLDSTLEIDGQVNVDGNVTLGSAYPSGSPAAEGIVDINSDGTLTMTGGSIAASFGTPHYGYVDNSGNIIGDAPGSASISEAIT